jgi:hypothetical protein
MEKVTNLTLSEEEKEEEEEEEERFISKYYNQVPGTSHREETKYSLVHWDKKLDWE